MRGREGRRRSQRLRVCKPWSVRLRLRMLSDVERQPGEADHRMSEGTAASFETSTKGAIQFYRICLPNQPCGKQTLLRRV